MDRGLEIPNKREGALFPFHLRETACVKRKAKDETACQSII